MGKRIKLNDACELAALNGGQCLEKKYVNNNTPMRWKCVNGHSFTKKMREVKQMGHWCPRCIGHALNINDMHDVANSRGGKCLSLEYVNSRTKLLWECDKGHQWKATPHSVRRKIGNRKGTWCPACDKLSLEDMRSIAVTMGGECLSKHYTNNSTKLQWKCKNAHIWFAVPASVLNGSWCPECSRGKVERMCKEVLEEMFFCEFKKVRPPWLKANRNHPLELDGYCSELNMAFEYNGDQHYKCISGWNTTEADLTSLQERDKTKKKICKDLGIRLIVIPPIRRPTKSRVREAVVKELVGKGVENVTA